VTLLRTREIREMTDEALARKVVDLENDLLRERGVAAMGGAPPSPGRLRALRTNLARALTIQQERRLGLKVVVRERPLVGSEAPDEGT
jgi:large subunit ribosomal protein L29